MSSRDTTDDEEIEIEMQRQHERRRGVRTKNNPFTGAREEGDEEENQGDFSVSRRAVEEAQYPSYHRNSAQNDEEDDDDEKKMKRVILNSQNHPRRHKLRRRRPRWTRTRSTITREP